MRTPLALMLLWAVGCGSDQASGDAGGPGADGPGADGLENDLGADAQEAPCVQVSGTPALGLELVESGFVYPVDIQTPPGDLRLFIVEQGGAIRIIDANGVRATPFLDLAGQVSTGGEQGLLGLAFHPGYAENGRFFVNFTDLAGDTNIVEFAVSADPNVADPVAISPVLFVDQPAANHNGGALAFGPNDGYLYIALGDGGGSCDTLADNGQSALSYLGKILRIDVDSATPYAIPATNPFFGSLSQLNEIWAYGVRNPWRISFDRETADLYIADVGQGEWEEIDVQPAASAGGENYGWNDWEADVCQDGSFGTSCNTAAGCSQTGLVFPAHAYPHASSVNCFGVGGSVTGGYVYRGCRMPGYHGTYFYADYCFATVHSFEYVGGVATNLMDWPSLDASASTFGQDALGEIYIADHTSGDIYRITPQ